MGKKKNLPVLPLIDVVVYPRMVLPLFVGRKKSINALESAFLDDKLIFLTAQKDPEVSLPSVEDIYKVGTVSKILQLLKLPDGTIKVLIEGVSRARLASIVDEEHFYGTIEYIKEKVEGDEKLEALTRMLLSQVRTYGSNSRKIPEDVVDALSKIDDPIKIVDTIAAHISLKVEDKQKLLEIEVLTERIEHLISILTEEINLSKLEWKIKKGVQENIEKNQKEYYLQEQMKIIQKELGSLNSGVNGETQDLSEKIESCGMPKDVMEKAKYELNRLEMMSVMSAESTVVRSYIEWLVNLPWNKTTKVNRDLKKASEILNKEHYGLEKVKERILEYLAVNKRVKSIPGPVLCLVGPPGVGKTSLAKSIANATKREYIRLSLGGVRDEAEIRGHRKTYIGALPGKIIQKIAKAKTKNPLFLLDEIDKMGMDHRGDPAAALLEVLDPEQNTTFADHYLEVDFDLSQVLFIATSNSMDIPWPLLDRMELIHLSGYTAKEKLNIAKTHLIPKQIKLNGIKKNELEISDKMLGNIISYYTKEAGVRGLDREINKLCRKVITENTINDEAKKVKLSDRNLEKYLGVKKFRDSEIEKEDQIGSVIGLAWTEVGGEILRIEAVATPGKGNVKTTGMLGDVMQESIQAAITVVRERSKELGIKNNFLDKIDLHVHVPEGATPKDGPSAGISMCIAIISCLTKTPIHRSIAMTGEITLQGKVLSIGGLKEKLLAAAAAKVTDVIIPVDNNRELAEIPSYIYKDLNIHKAASIDEVISLALVKKPKKRATKK